jgi:hypothetical protein
MGLLPPTRLAFKIDGTDWETEEDGNAWGNSQLTRNFVCPVWLERRPPLKLVMPETASGAVLASIVQKHEIPAVESTMATPDWLDRSY